MSTTAALVGMTAVSTLVTSFMASKAKTSTQEYETQIYDSNARLAQIQAEDAITRGKEEATRIELKGKRIIGAQRAALAAQGIEVNEDDALSVQADTAGIAALDALDVKNNAWREAWGYKAQASQYMDQAAYSRLRGTSSRRSTLITGGLTAARDIATGYYMSKNQSSWSLKDLISGS